MSSDDLILAAKTAMLERLVRALFKERFLEADDPAAAVESYAERFSARLDGVMAKSGGADSVDIPRVIMSEQLNGFFDQLKHDVLASLEDPLP